MAQRVKGSLVSPDDVGRALGGVSRSQCSSNGSFLRAHKVIGVSASAAWRRGRGDRGRRTALGRSMALTRCGSVCRPRSGRAGCAWRACRWARAAAPSRSRSNADILAREMLSAERDQFALEVGTRLDARHRLHDRLHLFSELGVRHAKRRRGRHLGTVTGRPWLAAMTASASAWGRSGRLSVAWPVSIPLRSASLVVPVAHCERSCRGQRWSGRWC